MKKSILALSIFVCSISSTFAQEYGGIPAITEDHVLTLTAASGRFINNGFAITLMGIPFDEAGFASGAGEAVNLEFYTADPCAEGFNLAGVYNFYDSAAWMDGNTDDKFGSGDLMGGLMYKLHGIYEMPMGSRVAIYDEDGYEKAIGLAGPGSKLSVTDKGGGVYHFDVEFITPENKRITGEWEGQIGQYVIDYPASVGIDTAEGTHSPSTYFDMQSRKMSSPQSGISLSFESGKAIKKLG